MINTLRILSLFLLIAQGIASFNVDFWYTDQHDHSSLPRAIADANTTSIVGNPKVDTLPECESVLLTEYRKVLSKYESALSAYIGVLSTHDNALSMYDGILCRHERAWIEYEKALFRCGYS